MHNAGPLDLVVVGLAAIVMGMAPWAVLQEGIQNFRDSLSGFSAQMYHQPGDTDNRAWQPGQVWFVVGGIALILIGLIAHLLN